MTISIQSVVLTHNTIEVDNIVIPGHVCHGVSLINQSSQANGMKSNT